MDDSPVFKALADPSRRSLLDLLHKQDGRTLGDLASHLEMTRFGVMKHLNILEEAGLVVTQKSGREKLHFLNTVPIAEVFDRWVGKYADPHLRMIAGLKSALENQAMPQTATVTHVMETHIRATAQQVWDALTQPEQTEKYYFGTKVQTTLEPGTPFRYVLPSGGLMLDGEVIECEPGRKLVTTFLSCWECTPEESPLTKVTYELEEKDGVTKLRLTHEDLPKGHPLVDQVFGGWSRILSGLKTLLETGSPL